MPVLPVQRGTLVMPLIGALDSTRLRDLQDRALDAIPTRISPTVAPEILTACRWFIGLLARDGIGTGSC